MDAVQIAQHPSSAPVDFCHLHIAIRRSGETRHLIRVNASEKLFSLTASSPEGVLREDVATTANEYRRDWHERLVRSEFNRSMPCLDTYALNSRPGYHEYLRETVLPGLADGGALLFHKLFLDPERDTGLVDFGRQLKTQLAERSFRITITTDDLLLPWELLYNAKVGQPALFELFWGIRHQVQEQILRRKSSGDPNPHSTGAEQVAIRILVAHDPRATGKRRVGAEHRRVMEELERLSPGNVEVVASASELASSLGGKRWDELNVIYFYGHSDERELKFADGALRSGDISYRLDEAEKWRGPLVFLNGCWGIVDGGPTFRGFAHEFLRAGAKATIGFQTAIPEAFASRFASTFFGIYRTGLTVNEAVRQSRLKFLADYGNPLGLLYSIYSGGFMTLDSAVGDDLPA